MTRSEDDDSSVEERRRDRKRSKSSKSRKRKDERSKKKSKRRDRRDYSSPSSSSDDSYYKERKRRKKERKKEKKHKKEKRKRHQEDDVSGDDDTPETDRLQRNYNLADALLALLEERPALVEDFPLLLIRLSSGSSFDLTQMTDSVASRGLARVFSCLEPFGVKLDANGAWVWENAAGAAGHSGTSNELVLVGLVRAMLDQIGLTMDAIGDYENPKRRAKEQTKPAPKPDNAATPKNVLRDKLAKQTKVLLNQFQQGELVKELAGLCNMILGGESVALDGLPDKRLGNALESLFVECALEKSEMEQEESDDDEDDDSEEESATGPTFGYGLPDDDEEARSRLTMVLETCKSIVETGGAASGSKKAAVKGPMPRPASYTEPAGYEESDSDDDEGPLLPGAARRGPSASSEMVRASAARRSRELASAKQGIQIPAAGAAGEGREEWMLVPGKFDLLSALKSGQPMKSRTFEAKSKASAGSTKQDQPVDPAIRDEIEAIRKAHEESRGPSLLEQHREKKAQESSAKAAAVAAGKKSSWEWDREKDLDSGRKVDKNALNMLFGSAGSDLKSKFSRGS